MAIDTPEPSPFSHEILNANPYAYLDDAPLEERRARAVASCAARCRTDYAEGAGALDPEAIAQVAAEAWPPMRDADELHEALLGFGVMPADEGEPHRSLTVAAPFREHGELAGSEPRPLGSGSFSVSSWPPAAPLRCMLAGALLVAAERLDLVRQVYPEGVFDPPLTAPAGGRAVPESPKRCAAEILRGWFECSGPKRASDFARDLAMPRDLVDQALAQLEAEGQILRGHFTPGGRAIWNGATGACWRAFTGSPSGGCGGKSSRSRRPRSTRFCTAGSTWRRARNCTAWMARWPSSASCRAASSRRRRGKR